MIAKVDEAADQKRYDAMFHEIHVNAPGLDTLDASLGTADEWMAASMQHLKCVIPSGPAEGRVTVSAAAVSLLIGKIEELMFGGPKLTLSIEE